MIKKHPLYRKSLFLGFFVVLSISFASAQNPIGQQGTQNTKSDFWKKVRFGGGVGLGLNNGGFNTSVSPSAIYRFNEKFAAGTALNFNYAKYQDARRIAYGASLLSLYNPIPFLQVSAELEQLRVNNRFETALVRIDESYWSPALFLGAGYTQRNFTLGIRYNVLHDTNRSIYASAWIPFVRVFF